MKQSTQFGNYWLLYILCAVIVLSIFISTDRSASIQSASVLFCSIITYIGINYFYIKDRISVRFLAWIIVSLCVILTLLAPPIIQWKAMRFHFLDFPIYEWLQSLSYTDIDTVHANVLAGAFVLLLPLIIALLIRWGTIFTTKSLLSFLSRVFLIFLALAMLTLLVLTQSRGGYLGFSFALLLVIILRWPRLIYIVPVLGLLIGLFIYDFGLQNTFELLGGDNTFGGTTNFRLAMWKASWLALKDFTFTGIGIGSYGSVMQILYPYPELYMQNVSATHAHNLFLQIGVDLGIVGLIVYGFFITTIICQALQVLRKNEYMQPRIKLQMPRIDSPNTYVQEPARFQTHSRRRKKRERNPSSDTSKNLASQHSMHIALLQGSLGSLAGMCVHGLLDAVTWGTKLAFVPWLIYALVTMIFVESKMGAVSHAHQQKNADAEVGMQWSLPAQ